MIIGHDLEVLGKMFQWSFLAIFWGRLLFDPKKCLFGVVMMITKKMVPGRDSNLGWFLLNMTLNLKTFGNQLIQLIDGRWKHQSQTTLNKLIFELGKKKYLIQKCKEE